MGVGRVRVDGSKPDSVFLFFCLAVVVIIKEWDDFC